jgi:hypothetical protein
MVLSLAISRSWLVHQFDVKNMFLHDILSETIYYSQPTEFVDPTQPDRVCCLNKSLYGLKQAPGFGTTGLPRTSSLWDLLRPSPIPPYSSSTMAPIQYTCCFILMTLCSPHLAQYSCSTPYLPSSEKFTMKDLVTIHHFWGSLYTISQMDYFSLSTSLLSMSLRALAWWTANQS